MSGEHERAQPQYADPDFTPPEAPPAPKLRAGNPALPPGLDMRPPGLRHQVPAGGPGMVTVTDAAGREITIRKISPLDRLRLYEAVGPALSKNDEWIAGALPAVCVTAINGAPQAFPTKKAIEQLVRTLGDEGLAAIAKGYRENFSPEETGETGDPEVIKKS
jgi:hypothetical protein